MQAGCKAMAATVAAVLVLASCGRNDASPNLMNIRGNGEGPDEFAILPPKSLEMPESLAVLPEPTPGGRNLTDPTPEADAVVALGGRPDGGAGADAGLMNHAGRYGTDPGIRTELAATDLEHRQKNKGRPLERLFNLNVYFKAYRRESLDQQAELERWRSAGARNVSAPPENNR